MSSDVLVRCEKLELRLKGSQVVISCESAKAASEFFNLMKSAFELDLPIVWHGSVLKVSDSASEKFQE